VQEVAEGVLQRFGRHAAKDGAAALARRIESFAARYGDEALIAVRRLGPEAFTAVEAAGSHGAQAVRVLARHGEEGATWVLRRPKAMQQFLRYGDEAATVLVKHAGVAESLVERGGAGAVQALQKVSQRNGRRLAMVLEGELRTAAKHPELLDVVARYGDRAAEFVWKNKGALAVGAVLTAFVANPEPFLDGAKDKTRIAGETVAKPLAVGVAQGTNWTLVFVAVLLMGSVFCGGWLWLARQRPPTAAAVPDHVTAKT
jgi:hypothetical protein